MLVLLLGRCNYMKTADIRKYAELMKEFGLTRLEIEDEGSKLRLECGTSEAASLSAKEAVCATSKSGCTVPIENKSYASIKSPIVGVFYAASAENAEPYVSVGDNVRKGQVLCIIEAMKLMNEITAEEDGIISEICVANGQVVEYGTELFRIERGGV